LREHLPSVPAESSPPSGSFLRWLVTSETLAKRQSPNHQGGPTP
jgi:hypothetical protein